MSKSRLAEGSGTPENYRVEAACVRAVDAYLCLGRKAARLSAALDDVTIPGVRAAIERGDSLVIAVQDARCALTVTFDTNSGREPGTVARKPDKGG
jgi:hypothetical protein